MNLRFAHDGVMTTRLLIISDTHLPTRARDLPDEVWAAVDEADVVVHAGDWADVALLERVEARARRLVGCWGNVDGPALRARLADGPAPAAHPHLHDRIDRQRISRRAVASPGALCLQVRSTPSPTPRSVEVLVVERACPRPTPGPAPSGERAHHGVVGVDHSG